MPADRECRSTTALFVTFAPHTIDPLTAPVHDIDPDDFVPPAQIANRSKSYL